ncbi:DcaP family trimeric outer membrane transporter [Marinobacter sp. KMM 10035]|uniref:DcaP family trimeric outer membrane transporter n=1 Tax=Marinobacter sp. KMM 10035 TaxID=3134034 RepID=UPI0039783142
MLRNKLSTAVKVTSSLLVLGLASQANAFEVQAGDYTADIYGYARLNASYDIDEDIAIGSGTRAGDYREITKGGSKGAKGHFGADALQSRIGVRTTTPEGVKMNVEGDFRTTTGTLRLRHAYGEYNGFLMGQTWSNYGSLIGTTSQLEFDQIPGSGGYVGRKAQVRYTTGAFSFSAEDPLSSILDNSGAAASDKKNGSPALTARFSSKAGNLTYAAATVVRQLSVDDGTNDDSAIGFGVFGAGKLAVTDKLNIQGAINYTDGANQYLWRSGTNYGAADAYMKSDGSLETISGFGGTIGASLKVGPGTVNTAYALTQVDWDDAKKDGVTNAATQNKRNTMALLNYQWSPVKAVMLGVQYTYLKTELENGDDGDANRLMFAAQYNF